MPSRADTAPRRASAYDRRTGERRRATAAVAGDEGPLPRPLPVVDPPSHEVTLGELGASLAAAIADVQRELARYPNPLGAYVLDELEVALPVATRVDELGQTLVTLVNPAPDRPPPAMVRFRLRPLLGAPPPPPPAAAQPLASLGLLTREMIAELQARRIFSVADLRAVIASPAGVAAVERLGIPVKRIAGRAQLFDIPGLPAAVSAELAKSYASPLSFARSSAESLAARLSRSLGQKIDPDVVRQWQADARARVEVPIPVLRKPIETPVR